VASQGYDLPEIRCITALQTPQKPHAGAKRGLCPMTDPSRIVNHLCRFCTLRYKGRSAFWDKSLICDGQIQVIPSKGAIVAPWLLVVPHAHVPSATLLSHEEKLSVGRLIKSIRRMAASAGQKLVVFENGSPYFGANISCGIEHVHIHMVALDFNLIGELQSHLPRKIGGLEPWSSVAPVPNTPYVYVDDGNEQVYFDASTAPSQFVRQLVAVAVGRADEFHYDLFPHIENAISTAEWFDRVSAASLISRTRGVF
jgi:diadenosine tetraphosphate (Ap4A) HIT family hydrolase